MAKVIKKVVGHVSSMKSEVMKQMLTLATGAFGLVAALAWNELIKTIIGEYIKPLIGGASETISLLIYAVLVTLLAVLVTYNLTKLAEKS